MLLSSSMKSAFPLIIVSFLGCSIVIAEPAASGPPPVLAASQGVGEQARRDGWQSACLAVDLIHVKDDFPGIKAWMEDFKQADAAVTAAGSKAALPDLKINELVTSNHNFWAAYYEILPGDPGLSLLHSGLLLAGGEAQRASAIATIGLQRPSIPDSFRKALRHIIDRAYAAQEAAIELTKLGVQLHDEKKFPDALAKYDAALKLWGSCGWTHYERGFTLRTMSLQVAGDKADPKAGEPPEVSRAFARARQHDPFQIPAYQSSDPLIQKSLAPLSQKVKPVWIKLEEDPMQTLPDLDLKSLAEGCQRAGIHDYALAAHSVMVARAGRYVPSDVIWISDSLAEIAPGPSTEKALQMLEGKELHLLTLVPVMPPPTEEK
jgi:hypothetical protein